MPVPVPWVRAMRRREFIGALGSAAAWPIAARAKQPDRLRRIGVLIGFAESDPAVQSWLAAFRGALAKLGWTEGSNLHARDRSSCPRDADNSHRDRERSRSDRQWLRH
jgi:putative ABC transport system substrate-binding protein